MAHDTAHPPPHPGAHPARSRPTVRATAGWADPDRSTAPSATVVVLHWPEEDALRRELAAGHTPRLLVIGADQQPPAEWDPLEDWMREPIAHDEFEARTAVLGRRGGQAASTPRIDERGVLSVGADKVPLSALQQAVLRPLLVEQSRPVSRRRIAEAYVAAGGDDGPRALRSALVRLRRRLRPLGVTLHVFTNGALMLECPEPRLAAGRGEADVRVARTAAPPRPPSPPAALRPSPAALPVGAGSIH